MEVQIARPRLREDLSRDALTHARYHPREDLLRRHPLYELVGVRVKVPLEGIGRHAERLEEETVRGRAEHVVGRRQPLGAELARELGHRAAFPEDHGVLQDLPGLEHREDAEGVACPAAPDTRPP